MIALWDPHRQANKNHFHRRSQRGVAATTKDTKTDQELGFRHDRWKVLPPSVTFAASACSHRRSKSRLRSEIWPAYILSRIFAYFATFCSNSLLLSSVRAHTITKSPARSETGPYTGCSRQGDRPGFPASPHAPLPCPSRRPDRSNRALDCRGRRDRARCDRD